MRVGVLVGVRVGVRVGVGVLVDPAGGVGVRVGVRVGVGVEPLVLMYTLVLSALHPHELIEATHHL